MKNLLRGNILCSVDVETTGLDPAVAEIIQFGAVEVLDGLLPGRSFTTLIRPNRPEMADPKALEVSGLTLADLEDAPSQERAADMMEEWADSIRKKGRIVLLAHNSVFEIKFLTAWLGPKRYESVFHFHTRDSMLAAIYVNDWCVSHGHEPKFPLVSLKAMCKQLGVINKKAHDALADSKAALEVYRRLCA